MNNIVNLKDGLITFNSNIDNSLTFSKCAIGFANDNDEVYERGSIVFLTNNNQDNTSVSILTDVKMSINSAGNVGIGSLNASENKLEVDGNISLSLGNTYKINNFPLAYSNLAGDVPVENLPLGDNLLINNNKISVNLDYYTGDSTINGDLIITSNLIVNGQSMQLNKTEFSTEKIDIANLGIGPSLRISQVSEINNILNISNYTKTEIFNITKDGHINFTEQINGIDKIQFSKIANIDSNNANCSNYVETASNSLFTDYTARFSEVSSIIDSNNTNCSNYVETASNSLFTDYTARFTEVSSIIDSNNANCSNYVETASNSLFTDYIARNIEMNDRLISEISTYVGYASNYVDVNKLTEGNNINIINNAISANLGLYNGNAVINGSLTVNSDLIINGTTTTVDTRDYLTNIFTASNVGPGPTLSITQTSQINNIVNVSNYLDSEVFNITVDGYINFTERINGINKMQFSKIANIDTNDSNCSNFIRASSNILFGDYVARDNFTSNFVSANSNMLFGDYVARDNFTSNFVSANSNILFGDYVARDNFTSNFVSTNSNILFNDYIARDNFTSNFVSANSNILFGDYVARDNFTSNFVSANSNILFGDYVARDNFTSNFVSANSNILFGDYVTRDNFTSNFVSANSNILFGDYVARDQELSTSLTTEITSSIGYVSNYIDINKYTDDKVKNVLSTAAGNNIVWNNETKQFDTSSSGDYNSLANKLTAGNSINIDANNIVSVDLVYYQGDATINGDLIVNSNLIVNGQSLQLNTTSYSTEKLDIINIGDGTSLSIKQSLSANNNNIINVSNYANSEVFNMTKDGYINFTERINDINVMQFSKIANIDSNDGYVSNYIAITSNLIFTDYTGRLDGLSSAVTTKDGYTSNYVSITSNLIFTDYTGRLATLSSTVTANDGYTSNYVSITSNLIFTDYTGRLATLSSAVTTKDGYTSNYVSITSNLIFTDYTGSLATLSSTVTANDRYTSNYIDINKYTDTKVKAVLATSAGNNMVWNNTTKRFDVPFNGDYNSLTNKLTAGHNINIDANNIVSAVLDVYNGNATINGDLTVNSNLVVLGTTTTLNVNNNSTNIFTASNIGPGPTLSVIQTSQVNNIVNVSNYLDKEVFNITSEGHINFSEKINDIDKIQFSKIANIDANDSYCSNFVRISNDILFLDYSTKIDDLTLYVDANDSYTSNYVRILDDLQYLDYSDKINNLSATVEGNNVNVSNYVNITSNLLFADYVERDRFASNLLFADYVARDTYTSNYVDITSNTLVTDYVARITSLASASISGSAWTISNSNIYNNNTNNVGIGTTDPSAYKLQVAGSIGATGDITASYSDERLKSITEQIKDVLPTLNKINGFRYICNDIGSKYGYDENKKELGLSAQEIQKYYPELVTLAPFDSAYDSETNKIISKSGENYLTLKYERLVPVLLQGIKELNMHVENIRANDVKKDIELKELRERIILIEERLDKINQIE